MAEAKTVRLKWLVVLLAVMAVGVVGFLITRGTNDVMEPANVSDPDEGVAKEPAAAPAETAGKIPTAQEDVTPGEDAPDLPAFDDPVEEIIERESAEGAFERGRSPYTGNITDLTPKEEQAAMDAWHRLKAKWGRFRGLSGGVEITYLGQEGGPNFTFDAVIDLSIKDFDSDKVDWKKNLYPPSYTMTLKDKEGRWTYVFDTEKGEQFVCDDEELAAQIRPYLRQQIAMQIWGPAEHFLQPRSVPDEELTATGVSRFFTHHQPMKNPEAPDTPDSYMYMHPIVSDSGSRGVWCIEEGHLASVEYRDIELTLMWKAYKQSNEFWFPTEMTTESKSDGFGRRLVFSNIAVDTSMKQ